MTDTTETMYLGNRHTLTKAEFETVLDEIAGSGEAGGIVALWDIILEDGWEHTQSIDPTAYAIPEAQWKEICQAMMNNPMHDGLPGGTMLNSGPSSYDSAESAA